MRFLRFIITLLLLTLVITFVNAQDILWITDYSCIETKGEFVKIKNGSIMIMPDTVLIMLNLNPPKYFKFKITERYKKNGITNFFLEYKKPEEFINITAILIIECRGIPTAIFNTNDGYNYETYEFKIYYPDFRDKKFHEILCDL